MNDTNVALITLDKSCADIKSKVNVLNNDLRLAEYRLDQSLEREKALEEALYAETLEKISYRNKADVSLMGMIVSFILTFTNLAVYYLF